MPRTTEMGTGIVPKPEVRRRCERCALLDPRWIVSRTNGVVSPTGIEHIGTDGGDTLCGKDATGDRWWWPL